MNRSDLKKLSAMRLSDAKALFKTRRNDAGAYYIAGYAIECAIKACIAKQRKLYEFPLSPEDSRKIYTHKIEDLIKAAGLKSALDTESSANPVFARNWSLVANWSEQWRYEKVVSRVQTANLINAIEDSTNGVLTWLKKQW